MRRGLIETTPAILVSPTEELSERDLQQLHRLGITPAEIERQLRLFREPPPPLSLRRPCRLGDGILRIDRQRQMRLLERWRDLTRGRTLVKFVPASGAATRMFGDLSRSSSAETRSQPDRGEAATTREAVTDRFLDALDGFAFRDSLARTLADAGLELEHLVRRRQPQPILRHLLNREGLGYRHLAKALVHFHRYDSGARTALEEQLREGVGYATTADGVCRIHLTAPPQQLPAFEGLLRGVRRDIERDSGIRLQVDFSTQSPSTDTIAVSPDNRLFRRRDGSLLLRPAGHGALIDNLQSLQADVVFIKNIDNVAHVHLQEIGIHWKRVLGGLLLELHEGIAGVMARLEAEPRSREPVDLALDVLTRRLAHEPPPALAAADPEARRDYVVQRLQRPLRVCGMVENLGEPGGGPFWVADRDGGLSGQIVERAQIDLESENQEAAWAASTHFNPVDLVCFLRDHLGRPFDLSRFVDPTTAFVTRKTHAGRPLKALERPGLWNGAMAGWNTIFVEVPRETFCPAKTVFDLLRPEHQPRTPDRRER